MSKNASSGISSPRSVRGKQADLGDELVEAMQEAVAHARGEISLPTRVHHPAVLVDAKTVRLKTGLSQAAFAKRFGFERRALQDWEQGRRRPDRAAQVLMAVIDRTPEAVEQAIAHLTQS
jgi:putative transcriptional regulator